jgi:cytidine deaminase
MADDVFSEINAEDQKLIDAAIDVLRKNYHPKKHQVGAAVLCASGKVYVGINVDALGYGPCAEPIAIGSALSQGDREIVSTVSVRRDDMDETRYFVISPCGNCRQLMLDYAPNSMVIVRNNGKPLKAKATDLLPAYYRKNFT